MRSAVVSAVLAALAISPVAAVTTATPATVLEVLTHAAPGDAIRLAPGSYDAIDLRGRQWSPPVTVDATGAQVKSVRLTGVSGLTWHGGTFDGGDVERNGINVFKADHIVIDGVHFSHYVRNGIGLGIVSDARVTNNSFADMGSDGVDIAMSRRIVVDHNRCSDFHPTEGAHPDCVQLWSRPTDPPTADVVISNNEAIGDMQGFSLFNHVRPDATGNMVDDGGFDRITVENNVVKVTTWNGIAVTSCRHCIVRHNRADSIPNPAYPKARASIKVVGGEDVVNCDNISVGGLRDLGRGTCRDGK